MARAHVLGSGPLYLTLAASALLAISVAAGCIPEEETPGKDAGPAECGLFTQCKNRDNCCPPTCNVGNDSDCSPECGDGVVSYNEICEPLISCPLSCDDGNPCTLDVMEGSADACNAKCSHTQVTWCQAGDGCCVRSCGSPGDTDCQP